MELRQIQYFLMVAQEQSYSRAAKKCYVSQQALSKAILQMEDELGTALFHRTPHGVELTDCGYLMMKRGYSIIDSVSDTVDEIRNMGKKEQHTITMAITAGISTWYPIKDLFTFQKQYPAYTISTVITNDRFIEENILNEKIDIGIIGAANKSSKLDLSCLLECNTLLAVNEQNPLSKQDTVSFRDLKDQDFILSSNDYYASSRIQALCSINGFTPHVMHQTVDCEYILNLLELNYGIFFLTEPSAPYFDKPGIKLLRLEDDPKIFSVQLATKKDKEIDEDVALLRDFIIKKFSQFHK